MRTSQLLSLILLTATTAGCASLHTPDGQTGRAPKTFPDYEGVTLPSNIAAPSFAVHEEASAVQLELGIVGETTTYYSVGDTTCVAIDLDDWHDLLSRAKGKDIFLRFCFEQDGKWLAANDVTCHVSADEIDPFLAYRLIYPGYELWGEMGIYQRDLTNYDETAVIRNTDLGDKYCVNCHNFAHNNPEQMMLHVRGANGGTVVVREGKAGKVNPAAHATVGELLHGATYPASDASGRFIAFSSNDVQQFFHCSGKKTIEVSDLAADLFVYDTQSGNAITSVDLMGDEWMETFPTWDGERGLYFCRAKGLENGEGKEGFKGEVHLDSIRYDLCYVSFDPETLSYGTPEVVYAASSEGFSCSFPRVSPDGKWLMFTRSSYGNFSIWHHESDLMLMNLEDRTFRPLAEVNSDDTESYHSWSSDGKWFVFSSRRMDGQWTRPYIAAFDTTTGKAGNPFLLPQSRPDYYLQLMQSFNIPELITSKIDPDLILSAAKE